MIEMVEIGKKWMIGLENVRVGSKCVELRDIGRVVLTVVDSDLKMHSNLRIVANRGFWLKMGDFCEKWAFRVGDS